MSNKELFLRYLLFTAGLFLEGVGIAFTKHSQLGVTPIASVPNVVSYLVPDISLGTLLFIWNCLMLLGQILILRRDFRRVQFLQIPVSFLFGWFTDIGLRIVSGVPVDIYPAKLLSLTAGIFLLALGVEVTVIAGVVLNAGEGFVKAVSDKTGKTFGSAKVFSDVSCVVSAVILSMILFHGRILGTREGTIISACCTGLVVKLYARIYAQFASAATKARLK